MIPVSCEFSASKDLLLHDLKLREIEIDNHLSWCFEGWGTNTYICWLGVAGIRLAGFRGSCDINTIPWIWERQHMKTDVKTCTCYDSYVK